MDMGAPWSEGARQRGLGSAKMTGMRRRDFGRVLAGGLVLVSALPANLPMIEELLAPERRYWFGWRPDFRAGVLLLSEHYIRTSIARYSVNVDYIRTSIARYSVNVDVAFDDFGVHTNKTVPLYSVPLGQHGPVDIEVWKHDGWYYGVLNGQVRGMERIPTKQEMRRLA